MKRIGIISIIALICLSGAVSAGYSTYWENPIEVAPGEEKELTMAVTSAYDNTSSDVSVNTSHLVGVDADGENFTLSERGQDGDSKQVTIHVDGSEVNNTSGEIKITHDPHDGNQKWSEGATIEIDSQNGGGGSGSETLPLAMYVVSGVIVVSGIGYFAIRNRGEEYI